MQVPANVSSRFLVSGEMFSSADIDAVWQAEEEPHAELDGLLVTLLIGDAQSMFHVHQQPTGLVQTVPNRTKVV